MSTTIPFIPQVITRRTKESGDFKQRIKLFYAFTTRRKNACGTAFWIMHNKANVEKESGHESLWWHLAGSSSPEFHRKNMQMMMTRRKNPLSLSNAWEEFIMKVKVLQHMKCISSVCCCADADSVDCYSGGTGSIITEFKRHFEMLLLV